MQMTSTRPPTVAASTVATVTAARMADVDRRAIDAYGITLLQMMEQAGSHLAEVVRLEAGGDLRGLGVVVMVGPGNNGGGGLVAARHLANRGAHVEVVLARPALRMADAARHQLATLVAMGTDCCVASYDLRGGELDDALAGADVILDAILGYGVRGAAAGDIASLIRAVVSAGRTVVSLDLPSGMDPDTGAAPGDAVVATATLTLALPKPGLLTDAGAARAGRLYLGDLGLPAALFADLAIDPGTPFAEGPIVLLERGR